MKKWENVTSQLEIKLTDEMRDELGLFDDAEQLNLRVKHSGYDDPGVITNDPEFSRPPESDVEIHHLEGEVIDEYEEETPLSAEQVEIILDGDITYAAMLDAFWGD